MKRPPRKDLNFWGRSQLPGFLPNRMISQSTLPATIITPTPELVIPLGVIRRSNRKSERFFQVPGHKILFNIFR